MVKKKTFIVVSLLCLMLFCSSLAFVGVLAVTKNEVSVNFSFSYQQGVYAKAYLACSDPNSKFMNNQEETNGFYYVKDNSKKFNIKQLNDQGTAEQVSDISQSMFFDSYSTFTTPAQGNAIQGSLSISDANCSNFGVFNIYIYIENYSEYPIWSDVKITYEDTSTEHQSHKGKDLNATPYFSYESGELVSIPAASDETHPGTSIKTVTIIAKTAQGLETAHGLKVETIFSPAYTSLTPQHTNESISYFDLGQKFNQNTRVELDVTTNGNEQLCGYYKASESKNFSVIANSIQYFGNQEIAARELPTNDRITIRMGKGLDGDTTRVHFQYTTTDGSSSTTSSAASGTFETTDNAYLFKVNGVKDVSAFAGKFYSMKIYDGEKLIHHYVPASNWQGVIGLYDLTGKTFLAPTGTMDGELL